MNYPPPTAHKMTVPGDNSIQRTSVYYRERRQLDFIDSGGSAGGSCKRMRSALWTRYSNT
jgi:hypothetical protein